MKHRWTKGRAHDNNGNEYNCFFCGNCEYLVVAFPQLPEESRHMPGHRIILLRQKDLTIQDVEKFTKKYDVAECPRDDNEEGHVKVTAEMNKAFQVALASVKL